MTTVNPPKVLKIDLLTLDALIESVNLTFSGQPTTFDAHFMVEPQFHSDPSTRAAFLYDGLDVQVGDYITTQEAKILKITEISYQDNDEVKCTLEDELTLNGLSDTNQTGESAMQTGTGLLFTVNLGMPIFYPLPGDLGAIQLSHLIEIQSRFQYLAKPVDLGGVDALITQLQTQVTALQSENIVENNAIATLQSSITALQSTVDTLVGDDMADDTLMSTIQQKINTLESNVAILLGDESAESIDLAGIHSAINNINAEVTAIQHTLLTDASDINALQLSINAIDDEIIALQTSITSNSSSIITLQSSIIALQSTVDTLVGDDMADDTLMAAIQQKINTLESNVAILLSDESAEGVDLAGIHSAINNINTAVTTIQTTLLTDASDIHALQLSINTIDDEIIALQTSVISNSGSISSLQTAMTAEQAALTAAQNLIAALQTAISDNKTDLTALTQSLATVATTGSYTDLSNVPNKFPGAGTVQQFQFVTASTEWVVTHNMNTTAFVPTLFNADGNVFYANVKPIDQNSFKVNLTDASTGFVNVYFP